MHRRVPVHFVKSIEGVVRAEDVQAAMNTRTGIISMSYVQFSNGFRSDLDELSSIKGNHAFVVNASQAAGVFEIDVKRMKIDALCATGHKWMRSGYGSGFVYISKELQAASRQRTIGWLSVHDPYGMRNDEVHLKHDVAARAEIGCPHFAGVFALGASIELMQSIGIENIQTRSLELNRMLTSRLGDKVLSPLGEERFRSAETLVAAENPAKLVAHLAQENIFVTEKPQGIRVSTDFFNNDDDIERLIRNLSA
jgi:selenocysteine lyase/cysteine desulfurase